MKLARRKCLMQRMETFDKQKIMLTERHEGSFQGITSRSVEDKSKKHHASFNVVVLKSSNLVAA